MRSRLALLAAAAIAVAGAVFAISRLISPAAPADAGAAALPATAASYLGVAAWWPGAQYVTWVGIDGYYYRPGETVSSIFGPTVAQVRMFTGQPVLLSETAVGPQAGQAAKIPGLFAGMREYGSLGLVWSDIAQHDGIYHQDWHIEDDSRRRDSVPPRCRRAAPGQPLTGGLGAVNSTRSTAWPSGSTTGTVLTGRSWSRARSGRNAPIARTRPASGRPPGWPGWSGSGRRSGAGRPRSRPGRRCRNPRG